MLTCDVECDVWSQFLAYAEERTSAIAFENWLAPIRVVQTASDKITLQVPNIFVKEYLLENYEKDLASFLPLDSQGKASLEFVIEDPKREEAKKKVEAAAEDSFELKLNNSYKFESFIEGPSNQFVKSAALGVANRPSFTYNPLFIHGSVGLGKTHLLHAVGHHIRKHHKNLRIQCITTEAFINELVDNLRNKSIAQMKRFYRSLDVLLVDDIQFLQNRLNFEEEFCNTFETLINQNKQIVITCDKPPSELKLSERLVARMEWGLVAQLGTPDLETRVAILQHKAEQRGIHISQKTAFFIAERIYHNVRQLEGAINRLTAYKNVLNKELTEDIVIEILGEMLRFIPNKRVSVEEILKSVATIFQVKMSDLKSNSRTKDVALPRQVAMFLAKELVNDSLMMIGAAFGKTHSTILHACKTIEEKLKSDERLLRQVEMARKSINS